MSETQMVQQGTGAIPTAHDYEPKIIAFLCRWCSYAGADLAGISRNKYPANIRIIRVPCSCRIDPKMIQKCLEKGVDGVLVSGCHPGDCHYTSGNYYARRRMLMFKELLEFVGIDSRRFQMSWVSASEGAKWAEVVTGVLEDLKELGPPIVPIVGETTLL
ncbi:MAG: hydrogenase iron-sulfur subunit [Anaerolineae bacterium]|nr:hydrogenase iron-sulfur subunit [Anaerolineae bacterium]